MRLRQCAHVLPGIRPQQARLQKCRLAHRSPRRRQLTNRLPGRDFLSRASTKWPHECRAPRALRYIAREVTPHFAAGLGDVLFRDVDIEVLPEPTEAVAHL